jgi:hypothetical protein
LLHVSRSCLDGAPVGSLRTDSFATLHEGREHIDKSTASAPHNHTATTNISSRDHNEKVVELAFLFGSVTPANAIENEWDIAASSTNYGIVNFHSPNDEVLGLLGRFNQMECAGRFPVQNGECDEDNGNEFDSGYRATGNMGRVHSVECPEVTSHIDWKGGVAVNRVATEWSKVLKIRKYIK